MWLLYFEERPSGWREDFRAALLMRAQGVDKPIEDLFPSLRFLKRTPKRIEPIPGFANSRFAAFLRNATGGDKVEGI